MTARYLYLRRPVGIQALRRQVKVNWGNYGRCVIWLWGPSQGIPLDEPRQKWLRARLDKAGTFDPPF